MYAAVLLVFFLLPITLGRPSHDRRGLVVRSQLSGPPSGFISGGSPASGSVKLTMALPQSNATGLHQALLDVSNPSSSSYRQHLTKAQVEQFVAPRPESAAAVSNWLSKNGITPTLATAAGDMLEFTIPVQQANELLNANFTSYIHESTNTAMIRTLSYALPAALEEHVSYVYPTTHFIPPAKASVQLTRRGVNTLSRRSSERTPLRRDNVDPQCNTSITPACLQALYNIPSAPATQVTNTFFVAGFGNEFADPVDTQQFLSQARPDLNPQPSVAFVSTDNIQNFAGGTAEATLDIQYAIGVASDVPITYISHGNASVDFTSFLDMANFLLAQDTVPVTFSTSYSGNEHTELEGFTELADTLCNAYAQLGARGTSVIFSSGDEGVAGGKSGLPECIGENQFMPTFPNTCPFLTSVGATQNIPETSAPYSSGGFSNFFPRPDYQNAAVDAYIQSLGPSAQAGLFNTTGRAYPDVSMQGTNFLVTLDGQTQPVSGTSASAPAFAAVVALLNDQLIAAGQPQLGFLNPLIYQAGSSGFNDITTGSNPGCGTQGFPAAVGWDPVTGMGTPDFAKLLALAMSTTTRTPPPTSSLDSGSSTTSAPGAAGTGTVSAQASGTPGGSSTATAPPAAETSKKPNSAQAMPNLIGTMVKFVRVLLQVV